MSNELTITSNEGYNVYVLLRDDSGKVYQTTTNTFVTYQTADRVNYDIPLTDSGDGFFVGDFPTAWTTAGTYFGVGFRRIGAAPADSDPILATATINWNGTSEVPAFAGDDLTDLAYVKPFVGVSGDSANSVLTTLIHVASSVIKEYCRNNFVNTAYTEFHDFDYAAPQLVLRNYPITNIVRVTLYPHEDAEFIDGAFVISTSYGAIRFKSSASVSYFPAGFQSVKTEYIAGYTVIPNSVQHATALVVQRLYNMIGVDPLYESEKIGDYNYKLKADAFAALSQDVKDMLEPYRRRSV
jgi:hypothetical protein